MKTVEYRNRKIEIHQDENTDSPADWGNTDLFLVYDHRQFCIKVQGFDPAEIFEACQEQKTWKYDGHHAFPVYAYIHSGVALSLGNNSYPFTCPRDTSFRGFILAKESEFKDLEQARDAAESLIKTWNMYLSGDVWGYIVEDDDSCWGFYGQDACIYEAKAVVDYLINQARKEWFKELKQTIRRRVPIEYRKPCPLDLSV